MVSSCFSHTCYVLCVIPYILKFYVVCINGHIDGWSNWVDLARSSFGVLSVYFLPNSSVVTLQLEHFTLVEWCLVVLFQSYLFIAIVVICICSVYMLCLFYLFDQFYFFYGFMEQNLARATFGAWSVFFCNNMIIGIEHFILIECCLVYFMYGLMKQLSRPG